VLLAVALFCRSATAIFLLRNSISTKKKKTDLTYVSAIFRVFAC